jgi:hypothetical protein
VTVLFPEPIPPVSPIVSINLLRPGFAIR